MTEKTAEENEIVREIKHFIRKNVLESEIPRARRIFILIDKRAFGKAIRHLTKKMEFTHVSTITGVDVGKEIEVIYHLNLGGSYTGRYIVRAGSPRPLGSHFREASRLVSHHFT